MDPNYQRTARRVSEQLRRLEYEYWGAAREAFLVLEQLDPEMAWLAVEATGDRDNAALWFGEKAGALCGSRPWDYLARGNIDVVRQILQAFAYGPSA